MECKFCFQPSFAMDAAYVCKEEVSRPRDVRSLICGSCVPMWLARYKSILPEYESDFKGWRKGKGLTQEQLAERLMVSKSMVSMVEAGRKVVPNRWKKTLEAI